MKITPLILCFLLLKATVFACGASSGCSSMEQNTDSVEIVVDCDEAKNDTNEDEKDCCGDSCDCLCCAAPVMDITKIKHLTGSSEFRTTANFNFEEKGDHDFHLRILQPPQLV